MIEQRPARKQTTYTKTRYSLHCIRREFCDSPGHLSARWRSR